MTQRRRHRGTERESGTPGHPARGRYLSRQVSWLAGRCFRPPSLGAPQWHGWTFARRLQLRGQLRIQAVIKTLTEFPLSSGLPSAEPRWRTNVLCRLRGQGVHHRNTRKWLLRGSKRMTFLSAFICAVF